MQIQVKSKLSKALLDHRRRWKTPERGASALPRKRSECLKVLVAPQRPAGSLLRERSSRKAERTGHQRPLSAVTFITKGHLTRIFFLSSSSVMNLDDLTRRGLYLSDIPLHDATRDLVLLGEQFREEYKLTQELEILTDRLQHTLRALEDEKKKTDRSDAAFKARKGELEMMRCRSGRFSSNCGQ